MKENLYNEAGPETRSPGNPGGRASGGIPPRVVTLALFPLLALNLALTLSMLLGLVKLPPSGGRDTPNAADPSELADSSDALDSSGASDNPGGRKSHGTAMLVDGGVSASRLYEGCAEAVVYLRTLDAEGAFVTAGSGFAISPEGLAMTAAHVVKKAEQIHAVLPTGEEIGEIALLALDDTLDTAVLRLPERAGGYDFLPLAEELPASGEGAWAIGYPLRTVKLIADGIVASPEADINGTARMLITTDLASGMSGGPILRADGTVIGIASATLRTMNGVSTSPTAIQIAQAAAPYLDPREEPTEPAEGEEGQTEPAEGEEGQTEPADMPEGGPN